MPAPLPRRYAAAPPPESALGLSCLGAPTAGLRSLAAVVRRRYNTVTGIATTTGTVFVGPKSTYEQTIDSKARGAAPPPAPPTRGRPAAGFLTPPPPAPFAPQRAWSATLTHKLTSTDTFKATMTDKADVPTVEWAHALGYGTVSLKMPLRGDAKPTLTAGLVVSVENLGRKNGEKKVTIA